MTGKHREPQVLNALPVELPGTGYVLSNSRSVVLVQILTSNTTLQQSRVVSLALTVCSQSASFACRAGQGRAGVLNIAIRFSSLQMVEFLRTSDGFVRANDWFLLAKNGFVLASDECLPANDGFVRAP